MGPSTDDPLVYPWFGACLCGNRGDFLVWNRLQTVGTFACSEHLWYVKKHHGGGGVERME